MIGALRTRLELFAPTEIPDALGGSVVSWVLVGPVWADIAPTTLSERGEQGRLVVTQGYKITLRYRKDFPERARLNWGGRSLRVIAASDPDLRAERLHLICEEEFQ